MHQYVKGITELFREYHNAEKATGAKAYMRNQFDFFGITAPLRRSLSTAYVKSNGLPAYNDLREIVNDLFDLPERELQYFGMELIAASKKYWDITIIDLIEKIIATKSWWDTVDYIAAVLAGNYFKAFPSQLKQRTGKWNQSDNFWLQRSSLLFQLKYKKKTDITLLAAYILPLASSKEFFIQKAIGWVLREYSKTDPAWVVQFVSENKLAPLSKREAMKRIS